MFHHSITTDWKDILEYVFLKHSYIQQHLEKFIEADIHAVNIFPSSKNIFSAFNYFNIKDTKVVIIGQDPYHGKGEADGLCFSVNVASGKMPPSLRNIFKELEAEYGVKRTRTDLSDWAAQGVLLINTAFTVIEDKPGSHTKLWKQFTTDLLHEISRHCTNIVVILWGAHAQSFECIFEKSVGVKILKHSHPSPLSRKPFLGNNHFRICNEYLESVKKVPVQWM
jgi:uracil-DNA glycosylase